MHAAMQQHFLSIMKKLLPAERTEVFIYELKMSLSCSAICIFSSPNQTCQWAPVKPQTLLVVRQNKHLYRSSQKHLTIAHEPLRASEAYRHRHFFPSYGRASWILFCKGRNIYFNRRCQKNVEISPILLILFSSFPCLTRFKYSFHPHTVAFCFQDAIYLFLCYQSPNYIEQDTAQPVICL